MPVKIAHLRRADVLCGTSFYKDTAPAGAILIFNQVLYYDDDARVKIDVVSY